MKQRVNKILLKYVFMFLKNVIRRENNAIQAAMCIKHDYYSGG